MLHPVLGEIVGWECSRHRRRRPAVRFDEAPEARPLTRAAPRKSSSTGCKHGADPDDEPKHEA